MKILWLVNLQLPLISEVKGEAVPFMGGWLDTPSRMIIGNGNTLVCVYPSKDKTNATINNLICYSFNKSNDLDYFRLILKKEKPDIIHVWGTEYLHTFNFITVCRELKLIERTIISIQGLVSNYADHYYAFLPAKTIYSFTIRDLIRGNIVFGKRTFEKKGRYEKKALNMAKHVIGRTDYDAALSKQINNNIIYHKCFETLRTEFYKHKWSFAECQKYSIFVPSLAYPIKGFHLALEGIAILVKKYPSLMLYAVGRNPLEVPFYRKTSYEVYLSKLIKKYKLRSNIVFLNYLSEEEMCKRLLNSNVFLCPSSIENSPNSLGEAMCLGVPVVAASVGGIPNFIKHGINGLLYNSCAPYMMAFYLDTLFSNVELARTISKNAYTSSRHFYDAKKNFKQLMNIYLSVSKN